MNKIDLGGIATKSESKAAHPTITVDAETLALLDQWTQVNPQYKTLKNQTETLSRQIAANSKLLYFKMFTAGAFISTVLVTTTRGTVKLVFKNAYSKKLNEWALLIAAVGKEKADKYFRYSTALEFAIDALPDDEQGPCADALIQLARDRGWMAAVKATQFIAPKAGFHETRSEVLTTQENTRLDQVLPITAFPML